jgi:hypothetical protein
MKSILTWQPPTNSMAFKIRPMPRMLKRTVEVTSSRDELSVNVDLFSSVVTTKHATAISENICEVETNKVKRSYFFRYFPYKLGQIHQ